MTRGSRAWLYLVAVVGMVAGSAIAAPPAHAADGTAATPAHSRVVPAKDLAAAARRAAAYWTPERMRSAKMLDATAPATLSRAAQAALPHGKPGQVDPAKPDPAAQRASLVRAPALVSPSAVTGGQQWTSGGLPATAIGRAFFTGDDGGSYACTATSLRSDTGNAVLTAGHCVINASNGRWYNWNYQTNTWANWIFVPGYVNGSAPYGLWYANQLWTVPDYITTHGDLRYDIGAAVMNTNSSGYHLQDVVGSEGAQWNWPLAQSVTAFGYPGTGGPGFNAMVPIYCQGTTYSDSWGRESLNCNQGHGASGGPWLARFDGNWGWADSVFSTCNESSYGGPVTVDYGPYFGDDMYNLWSNVRYL